MNHTDPRTAVLSAMAYPPYNETAEEHCTPWAEAERLLDAYRDAVLAAAQPSEDLPLMIPNHTVNEEQGPEEEQVAPPTDGTEAECICGHPVRRHFEDTCSDCDCGDCMEPAAAFEEIRRLTQAVRQRRATQAEVPAAASAVVSPPTSRADLRDRIAAAIWARYPDAEPSRTGLVMANPHALADAVLAVLPEPTSRAAVLLDAADELGRMDYDTDSNDYGYDTYRDAWNGGVMDGAEKLRRLAAEAQQQPDTEAPADRGEPTSRAADRLRAACKANSRDEDNWRDILAEEVAEAFAETDPAALRTELVQCAAVIQAWLWDLDSRTAAAPAARSAAV